MISLTAFGLLFGIFSLTDLLTGQYKGGDPAYTKDISFSVMLGMFAVCGVLPSAFAVFVFWNLTKKKKKHEADLLQWFETNILRYAVLQKGRVTAEEIAMEFNIGTSRAKEILESMVVRSVAELRVNESGTLVYFIHGINEDKDHTEKI